MANSKRLSLSPPLLEEAAKVLQCGLVKDFEQVVVDVIDCPDLKDKPFGLADSGLCGKPTIADVGGIPYVTPKLREKKIYNFPTIAKEAEIADAFVIGATGGPHHVIGTNSEMAVNVKLGEETVIGTYIAKFGKDGDPCIEKLQENCFEFCTLGNFFISEGKPGKVLRVNAKKRLSSENFVSAMRKALANHYGERTIGVGGVFVLEKGKAKLHLLPDSPIPLNTVEAFNNWLTFFTVDAPLVCLSTFVSSDPGLDLRDEHTHCFSFHGEGGHYETDVTPEDAEYLGYFNLAETVLRVDPPAVDPSDRQVLAKNL